MGDRHWGALVLLGGDLYTWRPLGVPWEGLCRWGSLGVPLAWLEGSLHMGVP